MIATRTSPANFLTRATVLVERGFSVIPLAPREKKPIGPGATSRTKDIDVINAWAQLWPEANCAICADETTTILESDDAGRLRALLAEKGVVLPETLTGGASENRPHMFFKRTPECGDDCITVPGIFEFRNGNQYVVGAGSIHPSGAEYRWWKDVPIVQIPVDVLDALQELRDEYHGTSGAAGEHVATGPYARLRDAYMQMADPADLLKIEGLEVNEGERHYTLQSLAGLLHDGERSAEDIAEILRDVRDTYFTPGKGDEEINRLSDATVRKEPFIFEPRCLPTLAVGSIVFADEEGMKKYLAEHPDAYPLEHKLAELNEKYCYVDESDLVVQVENMRMFDSARFRDGGHLANKFHITATKCFDSKTGAQKLILRKEKLAKLWLEWPERRQVDRIVYEPGKPVLFDDCINRWKGMGVVPAAGDVTPWKQLLEKLIPDPTVRVWFEQWCAYPLQNLGVKMKSAVVMWGTRQGTGKTTVATTLARIYGSNAAAINEADLQKQFNEWALDKQFVSANEITGGDKRNSADFMKELIAGHEHLRINQKFLPEIQIRNCINFLFTSNHPNSFYLEPTDRRYCIIEVPNAVPDRQFFDHYYAWLDAAGPASLHHHLLNLPLVGFHPHTEPPMTDAKADMIELGKSELDRWLEERREVQPGEVRTMDTLLTEYRVRHGHTPVKAAGMLTALRRVGAVNRKVSIDGRKVNLWCLDPTAVTLPPHVWAAKFAEPVVR